MQQKPFFLVIDVIGKVKNLSQNDWLLNVINNENSAKFAINFTEDEISESLEKKRKEVNIQSVKYT